MNAGGYADASLAEVCRPRGAHGQNDRWAKKVLRFLAVASVLHHAVRFAVDATVLDRRRALMWACQRASRWPGLWGTYRRRAMLRLVGVRLAKTCHIEFGTLLSKPTAVIGPGVYVGAYCCLGDVRIGEKTMLADAVQVPSGGRQHGSIALDASTTDPPGRLQTVTIGANCWIGSRAVVLADVGDHAVVGAGAVVTRPVEPYTVVAGVPAKPIGRRIQP